MCDADLGVIEVLSAVPAVRNRLVDQLDRWGMGALSDDAALAVSELVTNAVLHGAPPIRVGVDLLADGVRLQVTDAAPGTPVARSAAPEDTIGRGIQVVEAVSAAWGWRPVPEGKVVWCELRPPGAEPAPDSLAAPQNHVASVPMWTVRVADVPVDLLAAHVAHVEGQLRELTLVRGDAADALTALGLRLERVMRLTGGRSHLLAQLERAQAAGQSCFELVLDLPLSTVDRCGEYLAVLDEVDACCEAEQLLAMASPPQLRQLRGWLLGELISGVQRAAGLPAPPPRPRLAPSDRVGDLLALSIVLARCDTLQDVGDVLFSEVPARLPVLRMGLYLMSDDGQSLVLPRTSTWGEVAAEARYSFPLTEDAPSTTAARSRTMLEIVGREEMSRRFPHLSTNRQLTQAEQVWRMVPLLVNQDVIGLLALTDTEPKPLPEADRAFLQGLAPLAALALRRVLRFERDQRIAQTLQSSLLDVIGSEVAGLDVATRYQPAQAYETVGGDWHDVFEVAPGVAGVSVGDVCGHGVEAASVMGRVRSAMAAIAQDEPSPEAVVAKVNRMLYRLAASALDRSRPGRQPAPELLATALYGRLDRAAGTFHYAVAGHPGPIVVDRAARSAELAQPAPNLPLGIEPSAHFRGHVLHLPPRGALVAFTDGLFERRDETLDDSLAALATRVADLAGLGVEHLADALLARSTQPRWADDVALVVLGW